MTPAQRDCKHETLIFASGALNLVCKECRFTWLAIKDDSPLTVDFDAGRQGLSGEERVRVTINDKPLGEDEKRDATWDALG